MYVFNKHYCYRQCLCLCLHLITSVYFINCDCDVTVSICSFHQLERMQENIILSRQKEANLGRISLIRQGYEQFMFLS